MTMPKAIIVTLDPDTREWHSFTINENADLIAAMEVRGYAFDGIEKGRQLRPELQGHPKFKGLCGPMWGGDETPLRYESWAAYDVMSR
jgi:hypothetical protein